MSAIVEIIKDLLIFIAVMFGLVIVLIAVIAKMPDDNPLKRTMTALCYRVGATLGAGVLAVPIEPIPGLDALYDIAVPIFLIYYWFTFLREAYITATTAARHPSQTHRALHGDRRPPDRGLGPRFKARNTRRTSF